MPIQQLPQPPAECVGISITARSMPAPRVPLAAQKLDTKFRPSTGSACDGGIRGRIRRWEQIGNKGDIRDVLRNGERPVCPQVSGLQKPFALHACRKLVYSGCKAYSLWLRRTTLGPKNTSVGVNVMNEHSYAISSPNDALFI